MRTIVQGFLRAATVTATLTLPLTLTACTTHSLSGYADPDAPAPGFDRVAVFVAVPDLEWRRSLETSTVSAFATIGTDATGTMDLLPPTRDYGTEKTLAILRHAGIGALVRIELKGDLDAPGSYVPESERTRGGDIPLSRPWEGMEARVIDTATGRTAWISNSATWGGRYETFDFMQRNYSVELVRALGNDRIVRSTESTAKLDEFDRGYGRLR